MHEDLQLDMLRVGEGLVLHLTGPFRGVAAWDAVEEARSIARTTPPPRLVLVDLEACTAIDDIAVTELGTIGHELPVLLVAASGAVLATLGAMKLPAGVRYTSRREAYMTLRDPGWSIPSHERRRHARTISILPGLLRWFDRRSQPHQARVYTRDISEGGVGVCIGRDAERDLASSIGDRRAEECDLLLQPLLGTRWIPVRPVVHDGPSSIPSMGLEFLRLASDARSQVRAVVADGLREGA
jgi:hypothetical protein